MWHAWERAVKCTRLWWESPAERDHSEDQGVDGRVGSKWIVGRLAAAAGGGVGVEWIHLAVHRGWCRVLVNSDEPSGSGTTELVMIWIRRRIGHGRK
jgi:hypothetical protein